jgi:DNA-binding protein H-NS
MSTYKELIAQREMLDKQIEEVKAKEFTAVVEQLKQKIAEYGISASDLGLSRAKTKTTKVSSRGAIAPKYRDPQTGAVWSGRGKPPKWIIGRNRDHFLIQQ